MAFAYVVFLKGGILSQPRYASYKFMALRHYARFTYIIWMHMRICVGWLGVWYMHAAYAICTYAYICNIILYGVGDMCARTPGMMRISILNLNYRVLLYVSRASLIWMKLKFKQIFIKNSKIRWLPIIIHHQHKFKRIK